MVPKIRRGSRTYGLLAYLYGPGRRNEHTDPHLVGSWDGFAPDPGRDTSPDPDFKTTLSRLAAALDLRVKQAGTTAPDQHVWHCSVRTAPGDRHLTDAEWNTIAHRLVRAVNLAPEGDPDGCRWAAVRHADDHIHILATMVRGDLRRPRMNYDVKKAQAECRRIEHEMNLRQLTPGDSTAAKPPTSAERFKTERTGRPEPPRETLREAVRQALAGAADEQEFFARLRDTGLRIKLRAAPSGDTLGYSVALPGDRNRHHEPVWFAGSTLAPDLSLPKIRHRLTHAHVDVDTGGEKHIGDLLPRESLPARQRRHATGLAETAAATLNGNSDEAACQLIGIGELLDAVTQTSPAATRSELRAAARAFERATRSHVHAAHADTRTLHSAARGIIRAGGALGRGEDGAATAMLLSTLLLATIAAAHWHSARDHAQQAAASRQAAEHLRTAYRQSAATPLRALREQGRALPETDRRRYENVLRSVLPATASRTSGEAGRDALAATLAHVEQAGHDPEALLHKAIVVRELDTAENVNDVLIWRLRRLAELPAYPRVDRYPHGGTGMSEVPTAGPVPQAAPPAPRASPTPNGRQGPGRR
jgi:hypothetical protein